MDFGLLVLIVTFQIINVTETTPCFLNDTAGLDIWKNCGGESDYLAMALIGWEWITGGYFSLLVVSILVMSTYIKYHKALYPVLIGSIFLPISFFAFPSQFLSIAVLLAGLLFGIVMWHITLRQTKEYSG